jgi:hypothetical protein
MPERDFAPMMEALQNFLQLTERQLDFLVSWLAIAGLVFAAIVYLRPPSKPK